LSACEKDERESDSDADAGRGKEEGEEKPAAAGGGEGGSGSGSGSDSDGSVDDEEIRYFMFKGQRHLRPYRYRYRVGAKQRWHGRPLLDVYSSEFVRYSRDYFRDAILTGRIEVNGMAVPLDYRIQNGDEITHYVHRHEPPISAALPQVVHNRDGLLVVNKPPSMPAHACGRFHFNCLVAILRREMGIRAHVVNRLDRLTSGLQLLATTTDAARRYSRQLQDRALRKVYLARVAGEFPEGVTECRAPLVCVNFFFGEYGVGAEGEGKPCHTVFTRMAFNGHTSLVRCEPVTGRTHQIRVHLRHLGFPIANDPYYGGQLFEHNSTSSAAERTPAEQQQLRELRVFEDLAYPGCNECKELSYWTDERHFCTHIWLHALEYSAPEWSFRVDPPPWGARDFDSRAVCTRTYPFTRTRI
jgi:tRNA pseudouridine synthase 9